MVRFCVVLHFYMSQRNTLFSTWLIWEVLIGPLKGAIKSAFVLVMIQMCPWAFIWPVIAGTFTNLRLLILHPFHRSCINSTAHLNRLVGGTT